MMSQPAATAAPQPMMQQPDLHPQVAQLIPQVAQQLLQMPEAQAQQTYQQMLPILRQKTPNIQYPDQINHQMLAQLVGQTPASATPPPPNQPLKTTSAAALQTESGAGSKMMNSLNDLVDHYDPAFFTKKGQIEDTVSNIKSKYGAGMAPDEKTQVQNFRNMEQSMTDLITTYGTTYAGKRFSQQKNEVIGKILIHPEEASPEAAEAALVDSYKRISIDQETASRLLSKGINVDTYEPGQNKQIDQQFNNQADQVGKEMDSYIKGFQKQYPGSTPVDALRMRHHWAQQDMEEEQKKQQAAAAQQAQQAAAPPPPPVDPNTMPGSTDPGAPDYNDAKFNAKFGTN